MKKIKRLSMYIIWYVLALYLSAVYAENQSSLHSIVLKDETLIVPGTGASGIVIGMPEREVVLIKGKPFEKTKSVVHEFFKDVLKINSPSQLHFNYLYIYKSPSAFIGIYKEKVSFIVVWNSTGILIEGIPLSKGLQAIVYHYGNEGMLSISGADGKICIYSSKGIAFIDDKNDNSIDGIIIFKGNM
ncbi:MAG: hypothetical protein N3F66_00340 [Spirochaetes bacterium]|nr:hypothetical protein [Spirochaetota bacterium]